MYPGCYDKKWFFGLNEKPFFVVFSAVLRYNICWIFMLKNQFKYGGKQDEENKCNGSLL